MGTRKDSNSVIDEDAVHIVEGILRGDDWGRSKPQPDKVGLDMRVDLLEGGHPQLSFYLQIKGIGARTRQGEPHPIISTTGTVNKAIELEHLDYYMKLPVPVFLVVVNVVQRVAYYVHVQRYALEDLKGDDWQERLRDHKSRGSGTPPTKTIRVPAKNVLADTEAFKGVVRDARGFMASLSVSEGIAYREESLRRLDERFEVTYIKTKDGEHLQIDAKEPVEVTMRVLMRKEKFEASIGKEPPVELNPGEVTIEGSPLWESISAEAKSFQMKQQHRGFINIARLDGSGQRVARLEYLPCDIEGGFNEWRFKTRLPHDLVTLGFGLNLRAIRDNPGRRVVMQSTFTFQNNLAVLRGARLLSIPLSEAPLQMLVGSEDSDRFRIEIVIPGVGSLGGFTLNQEANQLFAWTGALYDALAKAQAVARCFKIDPRTPTRVSGEDLEQIVFLYDLIGGREVPSPERFGEIRASVVREHLGAMLNSFSRRNDVKLFLHSGATFPFLGETVHVDDVVHVIRDAKMITRKADIRRKLKAGSDDIEIRFMETSESTRTVRLGRPPEECLNQSA
jgi:hypothetical protein